MCLFMWDGNHKMPCAVAPQRVGVFSLYFFLLLNSQKGMCVCVRLCVCVCVCVSEHTEETAFITYSSRTIGLTSMCCWVQKQRESMGFEFVCVWSRVYAREPCCPHLFIGLRITLKSSHQIKCSDRAQRSTLSPEIVSLRYFGFSIPSVSLHLICITKWTHCPFVLEEQPAKHICLEKRISNRDWCDCSACPERQACEECQAQIKRCLQLSTHCREAVKHCNAEPCTCNSKTDFLSSSLKAFMPVSSN